MELNLKISTNISKKDKKKIDKIFSITDCFIVGGCIRSIINKEEIRDIDICIFEKNFLPAVNILLKQLKAELSLIKKDHVKIYSHFFGLEIDIMSVSELESVQNFIFKKSDFTIARGVMDKEYNCFLLEEDYKNLKEKVLIYVGSRYPVSSYIRARKLLEKGYTLDRECLNKILNDCRIKSKIDIVPDEIFSKVINRDK